MSNKPISLFECIITINRLKLLKNLIRHAHRWAHQIDLAPPLKKIGINEKDPHRHVLIREKINNLLPIAERATHIAKVRTVIRTKEQDLSDDLKLKNAEYDIFINYDVVSKDGPSVHHFDLVLDTLDRTIGVFREIRFRRITDFPIWLIAFILRIPITIIEYMGFDTKSNVVEKVLSFVIQAIWLIALGIISAYFGNKSELIQTAIDNLKTLK